MSRMNATSLSPLSLQRQQIHGKFVEQAHKDTLHGGVGLVMAKVRERHWVPRLRLLTKQVIKRCWECKRFQALAVDHPPPGLLPRARIVRSTPFETAGIDFARPIRYRRRGKLEAKSYVVLDACGLTRGLFLDVLLNLKTVESIRSLKRFIARQRIYSDNGKTFVTAAK